MNFRPFKALSESTRRTEVFMEPPSEKDLRRPIHKIVACWLFFVAASALLECIFGGTYVRAVGGFQIILVFFWILIVVEGYPVGHSFEGPLFSAFFPLPKESCVEMLELVKSVPGAHTYHQKILAQGRPVYSFDRLILLRVQRTIELVEAQRERNMDYTNRQEANQRACRKLNGIE